MVRVKSDVYNQTALGTQKPVSMVPTVLFVNKTGVISEALSPRDETVMANAITHGITDKVATENVSSPLFTAPESSYSEPNPLHVLPAEPITHAASANSANVASNGVNVSSANVASNGANVASNGANVASNGANVASNGVNVASNGANVASNGVNVASNGANIKGGRRRQQGGTPFAAFLLAAQQAAPTGLLLGAYATLPPKRRSRETRRTRQQTRQRYQTRRTRQRRNRQ